VSRNLPAGRAALPLLPAARAAAAQWDAYAARRDGDDPRKLAAAMARLRDSLAELGAPRHRLELHTADGDAVGHYVSLGQRVARAFYRARAGDATAVTIGGQLTALIIPAGRSRSAVTPGLVLELHSLVTGGGTYAVISRDKGGGYRVEPKTTADAAGRTVITDRAVLDAWAGGEELDDDALAGFAAATMADLEA